MSKVFRESFTFAKKDVTMWFPGHMYSGLKKMQARMKNVDCLIEVHDARIPISGRNFEFQHTIGVRPRLLILSKSDLTDMTASQQIIDRLNADGYSRVLFADFKKNSYQDIKKIIPLVQEMSHEMGRFHRSECIDYNVLVCGIPNVGKSTLINSLRHHYLKLGNATKVGAKAGVTRSVLEKIKVCDDPLMYIMDTPGILAPNVKDVETGMKLALCATLQDHLVGEDIIADYMLYWLNKNENYQYVNYFGLREATDDIVELLVRIAVNYKKIVKVKSAEGKGGYSYKPDIFAAAGIVLKAFRSGDLGKVMLDAELLDECNYNVEKPS